MKTSKFASSRYLGVEVDHARKGLKRESIYFTGTKRNKA